MDKIQTNSILKICPNRLELEGNHPFTCPEIECNGAKFYSTSTLNFHLEKTHKIKVNRINKDLDRRFFCPEPTCSYNIHGVKGAHFKKRKYLKQHFLKVHALKIFSCRNCDKKFATKVLMDNHAKNCGEFKCEMCSWVNKSRETLLSHMRRKKHHSNPVLMNNVADKTDSMSKPKTFEEKGVQTSFCDEEKTEQLAVKKEVESSSSNTCIEIPNLCPETINSGQLIDNFSQTFDNFNVNYFDDSLYSYMPQSTFNDRLISIETQTDVWDKLLTSTGSESNLVSMIYSNDMHTQTCDQIMSELGLSNIQTQTMWDEMASSVSDYNDLFVSTETQTSFSQCLINAHQISNSTQTSSLNQTQ